MREDNRKFTFILHIKFITRELVLRGVRTLMHLPLQWLRECSLPPFPLSFSYGGIERRSSLGSETPVQPSDSGVRVCAGSSCNGAPLRRPPANGVGVGIRCPKAAGQDSDPRETLVPTAALWAPWPIRDAAPAVHTHVHTEGANGRPRAPAPGEAGGATTSWHLTS